MLDRADEIFAAQSVLADAPRQGPTFGLGELVRFMSNPSVRLTANETQRLFSDRKLSEAYRHLKTQRGVFTVPALKAASDGDVTDRTFIGGQVRIRASKRLGQSYVIITFDEPVPEPSPSALLLESVDGLIAKSPLPELDEMGQCILIMDEAQHQDAILLLLLKDPLSYGNFIV